MPVPGVMALAIFSVFIDSGNLSAAVVVGLAFHCLCRIEEVMHLRWGDLVLAPAAVTASYPMIHGLVSITRPKLKSGVGRNNHQFATVEDRVLARFFHWLVKDLAENELHNYIFPGGANAFLRYWAAATAQLRIKGLGLTPSGLRPGGATHHYSVHQDLPRLRRKGRWQTDRTLEHYLHEVVYALQYTKVPGDVEAALKSIARAAPCFADPPATPAPPLASRLRPLGAHGRLAPKAEPPEAAAAPRGMRGRP